VECPINTAVKVLSVFSKYSFTFIKSTSLLIALSCPKENWCVKVSRFRPFVFLTRSVCRWRCVWSIGEMILTGENRKRRLNPAAVPLCPKRNVTAMTRDYAEASGLRGRWLAARVAIWPLKTQCHSANSLRQSCTSRKQSVTGVQGNIPVCSEIRTKYKNFLNGYDVEILNVKISCSLLKTNNFHITSICKKCTQTSVLHFSAVDHQFQRSTPATCLTQMLMKFFKIQGVPGGMCQTSGECSLS